MSDRKPRPAYPFNITIDKGASPRWDTQNVKSTVNKFPFVAKVSLQNVSEDHTKKYHPLKMKIVIWLEREIEKEKHKIWEYDDFDDEYAYFSFVNENDALLFRMRWG